MCDSFPWGREGRGLANYATERLEPSFGPEWWRNPSPPLLRQPHPSPWEGVLTVIFMFRKIQVSNLSTIKMSLYVLKAMAPKTAHYKLISSQ